MLLPEWMAEWSEGSQRTMDRMVMVEVVDDLLSCIKNNVFIFSVVVRNRKGIIYNRKKIVSVRGMLTMLVPIPSNKKPRSAHVDENEPFSQLRQPKVLSRS